MQAQETWPTKPLKPIEAPQKTSHSIVVAASPPPRTSRELVDNSLATKGGQLTRYRHRDGETLELAGLLGPTGGRKKRLSLAG